MKINLIVNTFPSASETFLFNLVTGIEKEGIDVTVCAFNKKNDSHIYESRLNNWSGKIVYYKIQNLLQLFNLLSLLIKRCLPIIYLLRQGYSFQKAIRNVYFAQFVLKNNPNCIHFAYSGIGVKFIEEINYLRLYYPNVVILISCRGSAEKVKPIIEPDRSVLLANLFNKVDSVHCVSQDMANGLFKYGLNESKYFINYPSIDITQFQRKKPYSVVGNLWVFTTTGRLHFQKGYIFSLLSLKKLKEAGIKFYYNILGAGEDEVMIRYLVHELGLSEDVKIHGKVSNSKVQEILENTHVFILPSIYEGVANAALEAMAMQIPVVTTKAGGMEEVIDHLENGIVIDRFDIDGLYKNLFMLVNNKELCMKISLKSRDVIESKFNSKRQIEIFKNQYKKLIDDKRNHKSN
jgi:colanic acid/amylovoran biosynthesis glycosyltransferase